MLWWLSNQLNFLLYRSDSGKHISLMWRHREDNFSQFYPYHENINRLYVFHFDGDERNIGDFCVFYPRSRVKESIWRTPWSKYRTKKKTDPFILDLFSATLHSWDIFPREKINHCYTSSLFFALYEYQSIKIYHLPYLVLNLVFLCTKGIIFGRTLA